VGCCQPGNEPAACAGPGGSYGPDGPGLWCLWRAATSCGGCGQLIVPSLAQELYGIRGGLPLMAESRDVRAMQGLGRRNAFRACPGVNECLHHGETILSEDRGLAIHGWGAATRPLSGLRCCYRSAGQLERRLGMSRVGRGMAISGHQELVRIANDGP
jgi:hypothetical protein